MSGDSYNPDATELTFPDGTKTYKKRTFEDALALESQLAGKVDAVPGKGLSSNDYTDADKAEVAKVKNKADEFSEWTFSGDGDVSGLELRYELSGDSYMWVLYRNGRYGGATNGNGREVSLFFYSGEEWGGDFNLTATRKRVLRTGDAATPQELTNAISTNNPAFVSAVRSISPTPSANIRVFDAIRQCWWIGTMVNGVINWEVE